MARITPERAKKEFNKFKKDGDYLEIHFAILDVYKGQPCIRTYFAKKWRRKGKVIKCRYREVMRQFLDGTETCLASLHSIKMSGWHIIWTKNQKTSLQGVYEAAPSYTTQFIPVKDCYRGIRLGYPTFGSGVAFSILSHYVPHFYIDDSTFERYERESNVLQYACDYMAKPYYEIFAKQGLGFLLSDKRIEKLGKEKQIELSRFIRQNKQAIVEHHYSYDDILWIRKLSCNPSDYNQTMKDINLYKDISRLCRRKGMSLQKAKEIRNYVERHAPEQYEYQRYVGRLVDLGMDLNDHNLMPGNFQQAQRAVMSQEELMLEARNKEEMEKKAKLKANESMILKSIKEAIMSENGNTINGYEVSVPQSFNDFVLISNALSNCLIRCEYDVHMAQGKDIIFALKKGGMFVTCNEVVFDKKGKPILAQCWGDERKGYGSKESYPTIDQKETATQFMATLKQSTLKKALRA